MNERRWKCTALYCSVTFPGQHCLACRHRVRDWETEVKRLRKALEKIYSLGHNDNCMFCGFKDQVVSKALSKRGCDGR